MMNVDWKVGSVRALNGKFIMPWLGEALQGEFKRPSLYVLFRWLFTRKLPRIPKLEEFNVVKPNFTVENKEDMKCTWIGHATCLLQSDGINIITDPVFSNRCSPTQWFGPKRFVPPACLIGELPKVHFVLISHDHYDHLDWSSIKEIENKFHPIYICGLELGSWFEKEFNIESGRIKQLDWWEQVNFFDGKCKIQFLPVQHWSKRRIFNDERRTLWGGFSVRINEIKFFFNGDTGYHEELYTEIGRRCGPFDLCAIPIGAYQPRNIMKTQHIDPDEAFLIHQRLASKNSIGIHHATFALTDEEIHEPAKRINSISSSNPDIPPFSAIKHGSSISIIKDEK